MNPLIVILIVLGAAGVIALIVRATKAHAERERQRRAALAHWAPAAGFAYAQQDAWDLDARYRGVADIGRGHDRYALEVLTRQDPVPAAIFRYHYKTWETRTVRDSRGHSRTERYEQTHWARYLIVELGPAFPDLALRPEGMFDRLAGFVGFDDIDFESEEFSKRYHCKGADRQFAYAVIHPQMMEWMLARPFEGELANGMLVMNLGAMPHTAESCREAWATAGGFVNRIPAFVWQDYAKRPPIVLPEPPAMSGLTLTAIPGPAEVPSR